MALGHLVVNKAWQDLACLLKNKVCVGGGGGRGGLVLFVCLKSLTSFADKSEKKLHLNWCLLAFLQHSGSREIFGLVAPGHLCLAPFSPPAQSWGRASLASVLFMSEEKHEERLRGNKGQWLLEPWKFHPWSRLVQRPSQYLGSSCFRRVD